MRYNYTIVKAMQYLRTKSRALLSIIAALLCLSIAVSPYTVFAQTVSDHDRDSIRDETTFYDLVPLGSCGAAAEADGITLQGKDNIQKAFNYFIGKGLTPAQSAGIVGNLRQESGVNPASHNTAAKPSGVSPGSIIPGETWHGGGIAQWEGGRWTGANGLLNFIAGKGNFSGKPQGDGTKWKVLGYQLNYMWWELTHTESAALDALKKTTTVEDATVTFELKYERAGDPRMANRIKYAKEVLDAFGGLVPDNVAPGGACGGSGIVTGNYSFPVAPQTRRDYGNLPCTPGSGKKIFNVNYKDAYGKTTRISTCHGDHSPAFDLMYGNGEAAGKPIYAITDGRIAKVNRNYVIKERKNDPGKPCGSIQFQSTNGQESTYYWYGHILPGNNVAAGKEFKAGEQIGIVATKDYGSRCWGGTPHLHIDRGCIVNNKPQTGGNDSCRDPQFLQDLQKIWENLPKP